LSVQDVVVGEYLWATTRAVIYGVVFLIVMAVLGLVSSAWAILAPVVFALGAMAFAVLGMSYTARVSNIEHFNIFFTGVLTPMFLFGAVFFPFDQLPEWAQVVGCACRSRISSRRPGISRSAPSAGRRSRTSPIWSSSRRPCSGTRSSG